MGKIFSSRYFSFGISEFNLQAIAKTEEAYIEMP